MDKKAKYAFGRPPNVTRSYGDRLLLLSLPMYLAVAEWLSGVSIPLITTGMVTSTGKAGETTAQSQISPCQATVPVHSHPRIYQALRSNATLLF